MTAIRDLSDEDLTLHAQEWRQRALRGDKSARGVAHALETELRRRGVGIGAQTTPADLDTRPITLRNPRPWWKFWTG
jgi:hypothetical protein